jgi:hypothetical protein
MMVDPGVVGAADCVLLGPVRDWTSDHDAAIQAASDFLGATVIAVRGGHVAARLPVDQLEGVNRWRWLAAAIQQPSVTSTPGWRDAAVRWVPTSRAGTIRMMSETGWSRLIHAEL